ncbi:MAG: ATP-binding cassette domain-containing protein, partial [Thermoguttaceae bacterium]|nr:ATP-binding cassette domain-containing protein [Thermoguttaceae bacterium]
MPIISCENLTKRFGPLTALEDVSFQADEGQIIGLLGPDGAGKTTLMRHLCGLWKPDAGKVTVLGLDSVRNASKIQSQVGYVPLKFGL